MKGGGYCSCSCSKHERGRAPPELRAPLSELLNNRNPRTAERRTAEFPAFLWLPTHARAHAHGSRPVAPLAGARAQMEHPEKGTMYKLPDGIVYKPVLSP
jgi:hypothetical protein